MHNWKPSRTVWLALVISLSAWVLSLILAAGAFGQQGTVAAFSGPNPDNPDMTMLLACNAETERCSFVHVVFKGQPNEQWIMGAGAMEVHAAGERGMSFCLTADMTAVGDINGQTGEYPPLLGKQACFVYLDGSVRVEGTDAILTADHALADEVERNVAEQDKPKGWGA